MSNKSAMPKLKWPLNKNVKSKIPPWSDTLSKLFNKMEEIKCTI